MKLYLSYTSVIWLDQRFLKGLQTMNLRKRCYYNLKEIHIKLLLVGQHIYNISGIVLVEYPFLKCYNEQDIWNKRHSFLLLGTIGS